MKTARAPFALALLTLLAAAAALAEAPAAKAPLGLADLFRVRAAREVRISPDGKAVAFLVQVPRTPGKDEDGPAWSELHVVERGKAARPFVAGEVNASRPKAPDDIVKPMALSAVFRFLTTNNSPRPQKPPLRFL